MNRRVIVFCLAALLTLLALPSFAGQGSSKVSNRGVDRASGAATTRVSKVGSQFSRQEAASQAGVETSTQDASTEESGVPVRVTRRASSDSEDNVEFEVGVSVRGVYASANQAGELNFECADDDPDCNGARPKAYGSASVNVGGQHWSVQIGND